MQLQFSKSSIRFLGTVLQDVRTVEATQELRLTDGMPDIGRVLTTWGQVQLRSKEWQGDTVQITGGVMAWTLYVPEDGTEPRSTECWLPFQMRWELSDGNREGTLRVVPLLRFADSRCISSRKLMVRAGISVQIQGLSPMGSEISAPGDLPEDVQVLRNTYPVRLPVEAGEKTFLVDEELSLPETDAEKLLGIVVTPEIGEKKVLTSRIVFKGTLQVHFVYRDAAGRVHSRNLPAAFSQLTELDRNHSTAAQTDIRMAVTSLEADLDQGKLRLKCGLVAQYLVDDCQALEIVQDAYSPNRPVQTDTEVLKLPVILEDRTELMTAEQTLPGQHGQGVDAVFLPDYPRMCQMESTVELEFPGVFQSLVYDENDALQGISSRWDGNQSFQAHENSRLQANVTGAEVQTLYSSDGMVLSAPLTAVLRTTAEQEMTMVTGLELGELQESDPSRPSLILRKCGEESLWDLAKNSGSTVAAISAANQLNGEPEAERLLLIPVM